MSNRILRTKAAASYLGLSESTVEKLRVNGGGPDFVRLGVRAVGYELAALDRWIDARRVDDKTPNGEPSR